jgi:glucuronate isomerase
VPAWAHAGRLVRQKRTLPGAAALFVQPDHCVFRMLYSLGVSMDDLEIGQPIVENPRRVRRVFASHSYLFRGTPARRWLDYAFLELFGLEERPSAKNADHYFETISQKLRTPEFLPSALDERFRIEVLVATTDSPLDSPADQQAICGFGGKARSVPTFRPDPVVDPEFSGFVERVAQLGEQTGEDTGGWNGYLNALVRARARIRAMGATASTAVTLWARI